MTTGPPVRRRRRATDGRVDRAHHGRRVHLAVEVVACPPASAGTGVRGLVHGPVTSSPAEHRGRVGVLGRVLAEDHDVVLDPGVLVVKSSSIGSPAATRERRRLEARRRRALRSREGDDLRPSAPAGFLPGADRDDRDAAGEHRDAGDDADHRRRASRSTAVRATRRSSPPPRIERGHDRAAITVAACGGRREQDAREAEEHQPDAERRCPSGISDREQQPLSSLGLRVRRGAGFSSVS